MKNDVISLVGKTYAQDSRGVSRATDAIRENIPCKVRSAGAQEWFEGGRSGLNPTYTFIIRRIEYHAEETVIFENARHKVYRTYIRGDDIELHTQREMGA